MWLDGTPIIVDGKQVAEVLRQSVGFVIRNLRPNGTVGVCFFSPDKGEITNQLNSMYGPKWTKGDRNVKS